MIWASCRFWSASILVCLAVAGACSDPLVPDGSIELKTDRESYALGETGLVTVTNRYRRPLTVEMCAYLIEQRELLAWGIVGPSAVCAAVSTDGQIEPGETRVFEVQVGADRFPSSGEYRIRTHAYRRIRESFPVFSNAFAVGLD